MRAASIRFMVVIATCGGFLAGQGTPAQQEFPGEFEQRIVAAFTVRVEQYAAIRAQLAEPLPPFDVRRDPWSTMLARRYLASAIRAAAPVKPGTMFPPVFSDYLRGVIRRTLTPAAALALRGRTDTEGYVPLVVLEPVDEWAMQPLPAALVAVLPFVPACVEYRAVPPDLILWDSQAEILIDVLPRAFLPADVD